MVRTDVHTHTHTDGHTSFLETLPHNKPFGQIFFGNGRRHAAHTLIVVERSPSCGTHTHIRRMWNGRRHAPHTLIRSKEVNFRPKWLVSRVESAISLIKNVYIMRHAHILSEEFLF